MGNNTHPPTLITNGSIHTETKLVDSAPEADALRRVIAEYQAPIGIDTETTGLNPRADRLRLLSIALDRKTFVLDADKVHPGDLLPVLHKKDLVLHNGLFDLSFLRRYDPTFGTSVFDTMLAAQILDAGLVAAKGQHSLFGLCDQMLDVRIDKALQVSDWSGQLSEEQIRYAALDAAVTLPLLDQLIKELVAADLVETAELENRCLLGVVNMAMAGVPFDETRWIRRFEEDVFRRDEARASLETLARGNGGEGINWNSALQVWRFFAGRGITLPNTQKDTLARVTDPVASALVSYRAMESAVSRYGLNFAPVSDGRIFSSWHQIGAASGRMSCSKPNLQAMPRDQRYRSCICARPGYALVSADLSQIELRIAAKISGDPGLCDAFQRGEDLHSRTAQLILGKMEVTKEERQLAKALVFGLLFGMGTESLRSYAQTDYGVDLTEREAEVYRERFFRTYPGLRRWQREVGSTTRSETRTLGGRRRLVTSSTSYTQILNTPIQGTGADGLKAAIALLWERREACPDATLVLAIHDELVVEVPTEKASAAKAWLEAALKDGMEPLIAPVPVEVETTIKVSESD